MPSSACPLSFKCVQFCAIININLAVVNLLPLPALDGGYLMLLAIEAVRGKKLPDKLEQVINGLAVLLMGRTYVTSLCVHAW